MIMRQCNVKNNWIGLSGHDNLDYLRTWTSFTCYAKDNQQGCFRLSNWFSLRRLGPWMNHLPPAWKSNFQLTFQNESWYVSLEWYFIYLLFLASVHGFMYETGDFFYSVITFSYTKCFVHSYTVDVVFTLSYKYIYIFIYIYIYQADSMCTTP